MRRHKNIFFQYLRNFVWHKVQNIFFHHIQAFYCLLIILTGGKSVVLAIKPKSKGIHLFIY